MSDDIKRLALKGLFWSLIQNWGGRVLSFFLFLFLARLLTPADFGVAAAVALVLGLMGIVAEQGFGDAIVQRQGLKSAEVNLPFQVSVLLSIVLALAVALSASSIEKWMNVPGLAPYLVVGSPLLPIATVAIFQEAFYRRSMDFKTLAIRVLVATVISGAVAVACAYAGFGAWSLVAQALVAAAVGALWLWCRPVWRPTWKWMPASFRQMLRFSLNVFGVRTLDFFTTRTVELIIVVVHGVAALGLYAVGAKVYQTLMQVLSTAITSVALSAFSKISNERARLRSAYLQAVRASAILAMPFFCALSSVSGELAHLLFGNKWEGSASVMQMLLLLGAVQCIQFFNGASFDAMGKPGCNLFLNILKLLAASSMMLFLPSDGLQELTALFVVSQLLVTPVNYGLAVRFIGISLMDLLKRILPFAFAAAMAYWLVHTVRPLAEARVTNDLLMLPILLTCFFSCYLILAALTGRSQILVVSRLIRDRNR